MSRLLASLFACLACLAPIAAHAAEPLPATPPLPDGYSADDVVTLDHGVVFYGAELERSVPMGGELHLTLTYGMSAPLPSEVYAFVHLESFETSDCRIVDDRRPPSPPPGGGVVRHTLTIKVPADKPACADQTLELFTGLYDRKTGVRFETKAPHTADDRMHAGWVDLDAADAAPSAVRIVTPSDMSGRAFWQRLAPWRGWLAGIFLVSLLTWFIARRRAPLDMAALEPTHALTTQQRRLRGAFYVLAIGVPMVLSLLAGLDYIKDDAYISFRYTHNLVEGHGLVFNPGEHVEGFSNFLWTVAMAPFEAMGWDLFIVSEIVGTALWAGILVYLVRLTGLFTLGAGGEPNARLGAILWGGIWLATSSSMAKWSHSGMEQALAMFLPIIAAWLLWRPKPEGPDGAPREDNKGAFWSGIFMGLGCVTRMEIHMMALFLGLPLVWDVVRLRRLPRSTILWFAGLFLVVVSVHAFRYAYYGELFPNTFYVKTGKDSGLIWLAGLKMLHDLFGFNATGALLVLAPFAFITKERRREKLVALAISLGFMVFLAKVGVDEMDWHRLYLPALPFLVLLAAVGLINLCRALASWLPLSGSRAAAFSVGWVAVVVAASANFAFTYRNMGGFNGRGDLSGTYHPDLGKFITRHDRPRALVAFQDMGSTPYHAPDIDFLDFIGLVDSTVAHARYEYGLHAFLATDAAKNQPIYDAEMRKYFYERNPEWTILTTYIPESVMGQVSQRFAADPSPRSLMPYLRQNGYQFGITDERFDKSYVHVRTWARSAGYYLSLYRRADLWNQTPGEVVLDAAPAGLGGVHATFAHAGARPGDPPANLELLGSEIQPSAKQRYEAFFTTWWRVPGPLEPDTYIFFHVERPETPDQKPYRAPFDTLPGDWMYPADRWKPGQIIEHRVLFQVPWDMPMGQYKVMMGVYRKKTGERLKIVAGPNDGQDRLDLGAFEITKLSPPWDELIPRCVPEVQRKYPERIIDSGRRPID